jgi:hypothetical protein
LTKGIWDAFLKFVRGDVVGAGWIGPAEFESAVHDAGTPGGGKVTEVTSVLDLALGAALLYEGPEALAVDKEVAATTVAVSNKGNFGVIFDPCWESRKFGGVVKMTVNGEHGIVRGGEIERGNVDGIRGVRGEKSVPGAGAGGNIHYFAFVDFAVDEGKCVSTGRKGLLRRFSTGDERAMEMAIIFQLGEGILEGTFTVEPIVSGNRESTGGRIPEHDTVGVVATPQRNAGAGLRTERAAGGS